jgi:hypothetical protein
MTTFYSKYKVEAAFAAEFITLGTNTTNLIDALEAVEECEQLAQDIQDEFGAHYEDVIMDCYNHLRTGTITVEATA